jgi:hypothetical protein
MKVICRNCTVEFDKPKRFVARSPNHFCSRSCSAIFNNSAHPKRKRIRKDPCPDCGGPKSLQAARCHSCKVRNTLLQNSDRTVGSVLLRGYKSSCKYTPVRAHAKRLAEIVYNMEETCGLCGSQEFDPVVELVHIRAIANFDEETKLGEVNARDNLIHLCPSHHRMFDAGHIALDGVKA